MEKRRAINGTIDSLKVDDDTEVKDYKDVLNEIKTFYKDLFSKKVLPRTDTKHFLESLNLPKISELDKLMCDQELTLGDLKEAMLSMCDDKSPGNDGLSREFYNFFWEDISDLYFEGLMDGKQKEELSTSQR